MTTDTETLNFTRADFPLGAPALVKAMGTWYRGHVVKLTPTYVHIEYTSGAGTTRVKPATPFNLAGIAAESTTGSIVDPVNWSTSSCVPYTPRALAAFLDLIDRTGSKNHRRHGW